MRKNGTPITRNKPTHRISWQKSIPQPILPTFEAHSGAATKSFIVSVTACSRRTSSSTPTKASPQKPRRRTAALSSLSRSRSKPSMPTPCNSPNGRHASKPILPPASIRINSTATSASSASVHLPIRFPPSISVPPPTAPPSLPPPSTASSSLPSPKNGTNKNCKKDLPTDYFWQFYAVPLHRERRIPIAKKRLVLTTKIAIQTDKIHFSLKRFLFTIYFS